MFLQLGFSDSWSFSLFFKVFSQNTFRNIFVPLPKSQTRHTKLLPSMPYRDLTQETKTKATNNRFVSKQ